MKTKTKVFISTKATLLEDYITKWLEEFEESIDPFSIEIKPFMSFAGKEGYMIGVLIQYLIYSDDSYENEEEEECKNYH